MNPLNLMRWLWLLSSLKAKLQNIWVSPKDLEWVDFNDMASLNRLAEKIVPWLLKSNPQAAKMIKESGWLDAKTQEQVNNVIDWL
jgi:hypothetical protein